MAERSTDHTSQPISAAYLSLQFSAMVLCTQGSQVTTEQLEVMGKLFCQALLCLQNELHPAESFSSLCEEPMAQAVATDGRDSCCCSDDDDYSLATEFDQFDESVASKSDERCLDHTQYDDTDT